MSKILELKDKRAKAWEAAKTFLDEHCDNNGMMSAEDAATYDKMEADILEYGRAIDRLERQEALDKQLSKPTSNPIHDGNFGAGVSGEPVSFRASDTYKQAVLNAFRTRFRNISDVLQEGTDASGGYLVPVEYDRRLIDVLNEENIMRRLATTIRTSGEHKINIAGTKPAAAWIDEGEALTFGDATFGQISMDAHKLHVAVKVTEELLYDNAFNLEDYLLRQFGIALANAEEDAFLNGDGSGKPYGIFDTSKGGNVFGATAGAKLTADDIISLIYGLKRPYRKKARFIMNDQIIASIRKLKDNNGAYIWQPSLQAGEPDRVLGYPVETSAYAPTAAAGKPLMAFGDFSYYNIGDRGTRSFAELKELFAGNGMVGFLAKERVDGRLVLPEAVQVLNIASSAT